MREIRTLRSTWRGLETWRGRNSSATPARQSSTLLMSGDGKRSVGHRPQATAPILNSTGADLGLPTDKEGALNEQAEPSCPTH